MHFKIYLDSYSNYFGNPSPVAVTYLVTDFRNKKILNRGGVIQGYNNRLSAILKTLVELILELDDSLTNLTLYQDGKIFSNIFEDFESERQFLTEKHGFSVPQLEFIIKKFNIAVKDTADFPCELPQAKVFYASQELLDREISQKKAEKKHVQHFKKTTKAKF
jgi:hypothetical protein